MGRLGAACALVLFYGACASADGSSVDAGAGSPDAGPAIDATTSTSADAAVGSLILIRPNGGEVFRPNTNEQIIWTTPSGLDGTIDIELWKGGAKIADLAFGEANDGTFDWTVTDALANASDYSIHIYASADRSVTDASDADFSIDDRSLMVTAPNGAESYVAGDVVDIAWTTVGTVPTVDIELHRGGTYLRDIALGVSNTGSYAWNVATDLPNAGDYTVVVKESAGSLQDASDAVFSIANWQYRLPITITSPVTVSNFQVTLDLTAANFTYANAQPDGSDLRFASDAARSNGFDLPHYTQLWGPPGTSRLWVRVPSLPAGTPVTIYLFYGISGQANASDFDATFPSQFNSTGNNTIAGTVNVDAYLVSSGHTVNVSTGTPAVVNARIITIDGTIDGVGDGYAGGSNGNGGLGNGGGAGGGSASGGGGGGYGGSGGAGGRDSADPVASGGPANGSSSSQSIAMGSGGGGTDSASGGRGGGAITLNAASITINGIIDLSGASGGGGTGRNGGGGSGGGILIIARDVNLTGGLVANGGPGGVGTITANDDGGGGAGGRVKVFAETIAVDTSTKSATGGAGGPYGDISAGDGGVGSITVTTTTTNEPTASFGSEETVF